MTDAQHQAEARDSRRAHLWFRPTRRWRACVPPAGTAISLSRVCRVGHCSCIVDTARSSVSLPACQYAMAESQRTWPRLVLCEASADAATWASSAPCGYLHGGPDELLERLVCQIVQSQNISHRPGIVSRVVFLWNQFAAPVAIASELSCIE